MAERFEALVIAAHPDDTEWGCGGTIAAWSDAGKRVAVAVCTSGEEGSEDPGLPATTLMETREAEQRAGLAALGVRDVEFLRQLDGRLLDTPELRGALVRVIRRYRPRIVFAHDPTGFFETLDPTPGADDLSLTYLNHPDHRYAGLAALAAVFPGAGNPRSYPELLAEGLRPHHVEELWLYYAEVENHFVDISATIERKIQALLCHRSQLPDREVVAGFVRGWAELTRRRAGPGFGPAEGSRRLILQRGPEAKREER